MTTGNIDLRIMLWYKQKGLCCYCGLMTLYPKARHNNCKRSLIPTVEHTVSKLNPLRGIKQKLKMACMKCNGDRATHEHSVLTYDEKFWLSQGNKAQGLDQYRHSRDFQFNEDGTAIKQNIET